MKHRNPSKWEPAGYNTLWLAVILKAVEDYRDHPNMRSEITRFLKSDYFAEMSDFDGKVILRKLKEETK